MKQTRLIMGMPITIEIADAHGTIADYEMVFAYFDYVDNKFSTYKIDSEISQINRKELVQDAWSADMKEVFVLSEQTKNETKGFFNIQRADGVYDPSGLVKGWAIENAAQLLRNKGIKNFYIEAGGDIAACGKNTEGNAWRVGIRNPFSQTEIIKVVSLTDKGIATSGNYIRGDHIYNPHDPTKVISGVVSCTVIGPSVYEADRFATAAFAMGKEGLAFIAGLPNIEAYVVDVHGTAMYTEGFSRYSIQ
jgi:thiamine biosynthesis lipoprotein